MCKHISNTIPISIIHKELSELNSKMQTPTRILKLKNSDNIKCWADVEKLDQSCIADSNVKWHNHSVNSLAVSVSYKIKHATTILPNSFTLGNLYQRIENLCPQQKPVHEYSEQLY